MKARVFVTLKPSVFDPQGSTIADALQSLGYGAVSRRPAGQVLRARLERAVAPEKPRSSPPRSPTGCWRIRSSRVSAIELPAGPGGRRAMTFAVVVFPGSNCDHDAYHAAKHVLGQDARFVWHKETSLAGADVVILPGGFSHGDYLRTGAIARFSPIMAARDRLCRRGRPGPRHLQRVSDPARVRAAARRDAAQPRREVSLRVRRRPRRADRHAVHRPGQRRARCCAFRSRTAKATTTRRRTRCASSKAAGRVVFRYVNAVR